jgi:hypothetical protein
MGGIDELNSMIAEGQRTEAQHAREQQTPGAASVRVRGKRVPLTPEGLRNAGCSPRDVSRALLQELRSAADECLGG